MPEPFNPYLVQAGDTLMSIAAQYGVPVQSLLTANSGVSTVAAGMTINVPTYMGSANPPLPTQTNSFAQEFGSALVGSTALRKYGIGSAPPPIPGIGVQPTVGAQTPASNPYGVTLGSQQTFRSPTDPYRDPFRLPPATPPQTPYTPSITKDKARGSGESAPYNPQVVGTTPGVLSMNIWTSMTEAERQTLIQNGYTVQGGVVLPPGMSQTTPGTQPTQRYYRAGNGVKGGGQTFETEQAYLSWLRNHKAKEDELKKKRGQKGGISASNLGVSTG